LFTVPGASGLLMRASIAWVRVLSERDTLIRLRRHYITMQTKNRTQRFEQPSFKPRDQAKPKIDQELIDDQKFQQKLEAKRFTDRIEREANEALVCPGCGRSTWRMHHKYWVNYVANDLIATMICRKCKRKLPFATSIEEGYPEDNEDEPENEAPFGLFGIVAGPS
jgi:hypothetical protein